MLIERDKLVDSYEEAWDRYIKTGDELDKFVCETDLAMVNAIEKELESKYKYTMGLHPRIRRDCTQIVIRVCMPEYNKRKKSK